MGGEEAGDLGGEKRQKEIDVEVSGMGLTGGKA